jgi:hypothetical protein
VGQQVGGKEQGFCSLAGGVMILCLQAMQVLFNPFVSASASCHTSTGHSKSLLHTAVLPQRSERPEVGSCFAQGLWYLSGILISCLLKHPAALGGCGAKH